MQLRSQSRTSNWKVGGSISGFLWEDNEPQVAPDAFISVTV